jgi:Tol biopolymer transport system component
MLYEMLARRKPFQGDTPSDTLAAILKTEPPPLPQLVPGLPAELHRIVAKTLRKDREERYQVVKDLWLDLKALKQELEFQEKLERSTVPDLNAGEATSVLPVAQTTEPRGAITSITESVTVEIKRHKLGTAVALAMVSLIIAAVGFGIYKVATRKQPVERFWDIKISRITNSGNAIDATISPDGKYIVYALSSRNSQSLYIRQVNAPNDILIVPPAPVGVFGMTFSPDGTELFYAIKALDVGTLFRVPVLGGTPVKVLEKIDGPISFSPDGKRFVFVRANYPNPGASALVIANVDGSGQHDLVVKKLPEKLSPIFFTGPSWSPDGRLVAATVLTVGGTNRLVGFSVDDGGERDLSPQRWGYAGRTQWLGDMSGLLLVAGDGVREAQIWHVSYPEGKARRVTNDLSAYRSIGLTADNRKLTAVQAEGLVNVWVAPGGDAAKATRLSTGNVGFYASAGNSVAWTPDKRLVITSNEGGAQDLWLSDPDGSNRKQLTAGGGQNISPFVSPDGRYVVYSSQRDGIKSIWRVNIDGSNQLKLTSGIADTYPNISPDGKWVIYSSMSGTQPTIWKVPIDGGTAQQITEHKALGARVSPDGKWLLYMYAESSDPFAPPNRIAVVPFEGGGDSKLFEVPPLGTVALQAHWSTDSKSFIYTVNANNVSNLWSQSIQGGPPKQITDFKDSLITGFAWSNDGKQLACTRGILVRDAVLIVDMK